MAVDTWTLSAKDIQVLTRKVSLRLSTPKADIVNGGCLDVNCTYRVLNDTSSLGIYVDIDCRGYS
jgi:hypothetical protein